MFKRPIHATLNLAGGMEQVQQKQNSHKQSNQMFSEVSQLISWRSDAM